MCTTCTDALETLHSELNNYHESFHFEQEGKVMVIEPRAAKYFNLSSNEFVDVEEREDGRRIITAKRAYDYNLVNLARCLGRIDQARKEKESTEQKTS